MQIQQLARPSWVYPGAAIDLDFANGRYWGTYINLANSGSTSQRVQSGLAEGIAGGGGAANTYYAPDINGIYQTTPSLGLRITRGRGLWVENSSTNYLLQCRDLTQAVWTASNITANHTNIPGCDGGTSGATRITSTAANGTISQNNIAFGLMAGDGVVINNAGTGGTYAVGNVLTISGGTFTTAMTIAVLTVTAGQIATLQVFPNNVGLYTVRPTFPASVTGGGGTGATLTVNDTYIHSFLVRRNSGTGSLLMTVDGTNYTDVTSQIPSSGFGVVFVTSANPSTISPGFKIAVSGDSFDVDMGQLEPALQAVHQPTTRMVTTTAIVPRGNISGATSSGEEAFYNNPSVAAGYNDGWRFINGFFTGGPISALIIGDGNGSSKCLLTGTDTGFFFTGAFDGSNLQCAMQTGGGTSTSSNTGTGGLGNTNKCAFSADGGNVTLFLNGVATSDNTNHFTNNVLSHGGIGNRGAGDIPINGAVQRAVYWPFAIPPGFGVQITT